AAVPMPAAPTPADTVPDSRPAGPGTAAPLPKGSTEIEPQTTVEYNLSGKLGAGSAELLLNYWNPTHLLKVVFGPKSTDVVKVNGQYTRTLASAPGRVAAGTAVLVKERFTRLTVLAAGLRLEADIKGVHAGGTAAKGFDGDVDYQSVEEVFFADDFMRTNDKNGGWTTHGGTWQTAPVENPDMGANPFSYKVQAPQSAVATIGYPFWDEYRFTAALRPVGTTGTMGLGWYAQDERNMYQFRASLRGGGPAVADGFQLVKLRDGKPEVLAGLAGGLTAGQWYKVMVKADGQRLGVYLDGVKLLEAEDSTFAGGQIALCAQATSARFDDVLVEPVSASTDQGQRLAGRVPDYAGLIDVDSWAGPATPWLPAADMSGLFWRCNSFFGDVGLRYDLPKLPDGAKVMLLADGDGETPVSGVSVTVERQGDTGQVTLRQGATLLGRGSAKLGEGVSLALRKRGNRVQGLIGDDTVVSGTSTLRGGGRLAFQVTGLRPSIGGLAVWSSNLRDYTFDTAPVDWWVGSGTWDVTNRWSCTPDWSWFGGYAHDVAAVWYKQPLQGDMVMDFYVGPKMLGNDFQQKERTGDFNAAICGDGRDVQSGYSFVVGPGWGRTAQILRKGEVVAQNDRFQLFQKGHNRWADVRVERHGAKLALFVDGQKLVEYTDPDPIPGGYAALWTQNNGVMLPRITLSFAGVGERLLSMM
ncbi:MAG: hypothetical protein HYU66_28475, partial [Armatimonadetes bacterium]|nr:hypothetical protein [Armatimonadota bacterium]